MGIKKIVTLLLQLIVLILINKIGVFIVSTLSLPIPGNVVGMIFLFLLLWTRVIKLEWIEGASSLLIRHLAFFFIPISVGLMTLGYVFVKNGIALMLVLLGSTLIGILVTGKLSQSLVKRKEETEVEYRHHVL